MLLFHSDPRKQRDHNPGTANAFRAAGWQLGVTVLLLDFCKAFIPVVAARWLIGFPDDQQLLWIAVMPTLGHALFYLSTLPWWPRHRRHVRRLGRSDALSHPPDNGPHCTCRSLSFKKDEYRTLAIPLILIAYLLLTSIPGWMVLLAGVQLIVLALKMGAYV